MHRTPPTRLTDEDVAAILDGTVPAGRSGRGLAEAAQALAPRVAPREQYRDQLKDALLREFRRQHTTAPEIPLGIDKASEHTPLSGHQPVSLVFDGVQVDIADIDSLDPRGSVNDAMAVMRIAAAHAATDRRS